jgi:DNA-binding response OmpR family regulator
MEDDAALAFELRSHLEQDGFDVSWCRDANEAMVVLRNQPVSLVITDIYVFENGKPGASGGISLIGAIRACRYRPGSEKIGTIPVIAISAAASNPANPYILNTASSVGATHTMAKPVDYHDLYALITATLYPPPNAGQVNTSAN